MVFVYQSEVLAVLGRTISITTLPLAYDTPDQ